MGGTQGPGGGNARNAGVVDAQAALRSEIRAVELATAKAFPGIDHTWSADGQWLLRAGDGITGRSNSATPLGPAAARTDLPLSLPLDEIRKFYAHHRLPIRVHVPDLIAGEALTLCRPPLWQVGEDIVVMTRRLVGQEDTLPLADVQADSPGCRGVVVSVDDQPDDEWLAQYHFRGQALPVEALRLLRLEIDGTIGFARLRLDGRTVAVTRATLTASDDGRVWLGYSAVEVAPKYRRRGLGTQLGRAVLRWGVEHGASDAYLQVLSSNEAGRALYERLGFAEHHRHRYTRLL